MPVENPECVVSVFIVIKKQEQVRKGARAASTSGTGSVRGFRRAQHQAAVLSVGQTQQRPCALLGIFGRCFML
jgi:hypothetical protein